MMTSKKSAPYGSWISPISADMISAHSIEMNEISNDGDFIYWLENRPDESGRNVIMQFNENCGIRNILPDGFSVRSRVHEYGGGAYKVKDGVVYFCNASDQRIYFMIPGEEPAALTPRADKRYADFDFDLIKNRLICICEDHSLPNQQVNNSIIAISLNEDHSIEPLVSGNDFYSNPRINPENSKICWMAWDHPNMPWDASELWIGDFDEHGKISQPRHIAGGNSESIFQPEWSPDGVLHFISDRSGWWNPYYLQNGNVIRFCEKEAEFGRPQWVFGLSVFGFLNENEIVYSVSSSGKDELIKVNLNSEAPSCISSVYTDYSSVNVHNKQIYFVGRSIDRPAELVRFDYETGEMKILRKSGSLNLEDRSISRGKEIKFSSHYDLKSHGNFYPPKNDGYEADPNEKPPLIVMIHSGPTRSTSMALNLKIQYWTSRGFAVLDVNYSGSSGYGRAYRERLYGQWGKLDVFDCVKGAEYLADKHLVDGQRMSISGGSAGGYTALCALTFHRKFAAGVSRYGISSLEGIISDSHKFEAHYLENLIGPDYLSKKLLEKRSPINYIKDIKVPVLILQGSEDVVVPVSQSELLFQGLDANHLPVAYVLFEGEQHGFRKSESISRALEIEYYFYSQIFDFYLPEAIDPVEIRNL